MKALERPSYLNKNPEQKFWEIQVEYLDANKEHQCSFHFFNCPAKAAAFARSNRVGFNVKDFFYSDVEKLSKRRGVKHFF